MKQDMRVLMGLRMVLEHTIFRSFWKEYQMPKGIKSTHIMTAMALYRRGPLSMSKLSHMMNMEKGSLTTVADRMINLGYATRSRSEMDRRVYEIDLTEKGQVLASEFESAHMEYVMGLFEELPEAQRQAFFTSAEELLHTILEINKDPELKRHFYEKTRN